MESKHYGQIRVIVFESSPIVEIDPYVLSEILGKPVLVILDGSEYNELTMVQFKHVSIKPVGIDGASTERVLRTISLGSSIPAISMAKKITNSF